MKIGTALLIGGGAYLAYKLWQKANAVMGLTVSVKKIKWGGTDLSKTWFDVDLGIVNPSGESFSFTRFFGQLRFNGELLATTTKDGAGSDITIKPASETVITIPVTISHLSTGVSLVAIISKLINKEPIQGLQFNGMLYAANLSVPVTQTLNLNFPTASGQGLSGRPFRMGNCFTCAASKVSGVLN
jgi:hypothetical protein